MSESIQVHVLSILRIVNFVAFRKAGVKFMVNAFSLANSQPLKGFL